MTTFCTRIFKKTILLQVESVGRERASDRAREKERAHFTLYTLRLARRRVGVRTIRGWARPGSRWRHPCKGIVRVGPFQRSIQVHIETVQVVGINLRNCSGLGISDWAPGIDLDVF